MIVVNADAVLDHAAVVVVLDAAGLARTAVMHPGQLVDLAPFLTVFELALIFHLIVDEALRQVVVLENHLIEVVSEVKLQRVVLLTLVNLLAMLQGTLELDLKPLEALIKHELFYL